MFVVTGFMRLAAGPNPSTTARLAASQRPARSPQKPVVRATLVLAHPLPAAAARFFISSADTSSLCVAIHHTCPYGSVNPPDRSPYH